MHPRDLLPSPRMFLRAALTGVITLALALTPVHARAMQQPATSDRDVDGVADDVDQCPDTYGAPTNGGCPPQAQPPAVTDRDYDAVPDAQDACPDVAAATPNGCPADATTTTTTTPPPADVDPNDEYQVVLRSLPNDYDINYTFDGQAKKFKRENDPGRVAKRASALGIAGGTLTLVGVVAGLSTMTAGLVMSKQAKDELEGMEFDSTSPIDPNGERADLIEKGERGDKVAIIGSAASGGVAALGIMLLLGARSLRKKQYNTAAPSAGSSRMSDADRKKFILTGGLLVVYGAIGMAIGGALMANKDETKKKRGKAVLGVSGALAGVGVLLLLPPFIAKRRGSAQMTAGPMYVKRGGGAGLAMRF